MTRDDIIRMAEEAGLPMRQRNVIPLWDTEISRFAHLVAAAERKACEMTIEELMPDVDRGDCASAIRARS